MRTTIWPAIPAVILNLLAGTGMADEMRRLAVGNLAAASDNSHSGARQPARSVASDIDQPIRRFKKQAIQQASVSTGLVRALDEDLSSSSVDVSLRLGVPLGSFDNILGVTPSFRVDSFDTAPELDVPTELYETGVQFFWRKPVSDHWSAMTIIRPAVRSDFTASDNALRVFGLGLLTWKCVPDTLSMSVGAVYLDRADIPLLPAVGLLWTPQPTTRIDLRFPESRMSYRVAKDGTISETWAYLSGSLGGNTWAVTRRSGLEDELSIRDLRFLVGVEHVVDGGAGWFVEAGYAFNRRIEFESAATAIELGDASLFRGGLSW